jgi:hypothetical protein
VLELYVHCARHSYTSGSFFVGRTLDCIHCVLCNLSHSRWIEDASDDESGDAYSETHDPLDPGPNDRDLTKARKFKDMMAAGQVDAKVETMVDKAFRTSASLTSSIHRPCNIMDRETWVHATWIQWFTFSVGLQRTCSINNMITTSHEPRPIPRTEINQI